MLYNKTEQKELSYAPEFGGMNAAKKKRVLNIFLNLEKRSHVKKHIRKIAYQWLCDLRPFLYSLRPKTIL